MAKNRKMAKGHERPKNAKKTLARLLKEIFAHNKIALVVVIICVLVSSLTTVYISTILKTLIDDFIMPLTQSANPDFSLLIRELGKWGSIMILSVLATYLQTRIMIGISLHSLESLRNRMFARMQRLPVKYYDENQHGVLMSLYTNDIDSIQQMISQSLIGTFSALLTVVAVFIAMLINNWLLTVVIVITISSILSIVVSLGKKSAKNFKAQQANLANANAYIEEMLNGSRVVKVFTREEKCINEFDVINEELCKTTTRANSLANILMPIMSNLGNIQYVIIVLVGSILSVVTAGSYSVGALAAFLQLSRSFTNPLGQIANQMNFFLQSIAGAERVYKLLDEEEEVDNGYVTLVKDEDTTKDLWYWKHPHSDGSVTYEEVKGLVELFDVDFSYVKDKLVLEDISVYAKEGQKIAFVGSTGAGKTTITNLLNRFYDIQDGKIRIDGININKIKKDDLRASLGFVLQDTNLFTGSIKDNIKYGKLDATDDEVIQAAKLANAHDFITKLEHGYDTIIKDGGSSLSQGQKQLLSIARAAVKNPPIMVLDEATSSIDTHTEALIQKGMDSLMKDRTVFVIAHRLSTVRNSNAIMVLEHGKIIERGNHEQLLEEKGTYYNLYTGSFELS